ncbi:MAG TPA: TlpA disulfide reductase family protein [Limnochordia bacterium]|nr:TlpA disulfide reductase family protein [Limnochordia bacterium]
MRRSKWLLVAGLVVVVAGVLWWALRPRPTVVTGPPEIAVVITGTSVFPDHLALKVGVPVRLELLSLDGPTVLQGPGPTRDVRWAIDGNGVTQIDYTPGERGTELLRTPAGGWLEMQLVGADPAPADEVALIATPAGLHPPAGRISNGAVEVGVAAQGEDARISIGDERLQVAAGKFAQHQVPAGEAALAVRAGHQVSRFERAGSAVRTGIEPGMKTPDFTAKTPFDKAVTYDQYKGRPLILAFWGAWMDESITQLKAFEAVKQAHPELAVLAVDLGDTPARINEIAAQNNLTSVMLVDTNSSVGNAFGVSRLPVSLFIAPDGVIQAHYIGPIDAARLKILLASIGLS